MSHKPLPTRHAENCTLPCGLRGLFFPSFQEINAARVDAALFSPSSSSLPDSGRGVSRLRAPLAACGPSFPGASPGTHLGLPTSVSRVGLKRSSPRPPLLLLFGAAIVSTCCSLAAAISSPSFSVSRDDRDRSVCCWFFFLLYLVRFFRSPLFPETRRTVKWSERTACAAARPPSIARAPLFPFAVLPPFAPQTRRVDLLLAREGLSAAVILELIRKSFAGCPQKDFVSTVVDSWASSAVQKLSRVVPRPHPLEDRQLSSGKNVLLLATFVGHDFSPDFLLISMQVPRTSPDPPNAFQPVETNSAGC